MCSIFGLASYVTQKWIATKTFAFSSQEEREREITVRLISSVHVGDEARQWCWLDLEGEGRVDDEGTREEEEHGAIGVEGGVLLGRDVGEGGQCCGGQGGRGGGGCGSSGSQRRRG
jgi:hypothetical protein